MANLSKDKEALKPNPHPYAIKTTSTALLSRSNSSSQSARPIHSYIPSPSPSPTRSRPSQRQYGYSHGSGHRYSRSLTGESPRPLPVPPSPSPTKQLYTSGHGHSPSFDVDLPANPKLWTPSQLATYLATALRVRSGESLQLPAPVARDIAAFVKTSKITGKEFLRFNEQDLNEYVMLLRRADLGVDISLAMASTSCGRPLSLQHRVLSGRMFLKAVFGDSVTVTSMVLPARILLLGTTSNMTLLRPPRLSTSIDLTQTTTSSILPFNPMLNIRWTT